MIEVYMAEQDVLELILRKLDNLTSTQNATLGQIGELNQTVKQALELAEKHQKILRGGNGDGIGMVAKVSGLEKMVCDDHELLHGKIENPGLKGTVSSLVKAVENYTRLVWVILGAALTGLAKLVFDLF